MKEMYLRFPGGKRKAFTLSYDDNITQDERLIELMKKYKIKGTFNLIPGWFASEDAVFPEGETYINVTEKKALELYDNEFVEVANHGFRHGRMTAQPAIQKMEEIIECRKKLEKMFGRLVTGFAYPYGTYDGEVMTVLEKCGISYARTVCSTYDFNLPENWLELHPTCHHADEKLEGLTERFLTEKVSENPYLFYVWGHTFEFDQQDNWEIIEQLLAKISGREDEIWYATNGEICEYHKAYQQLVFSAEADRIFNPTAVDLWIETGKKIYEVPAGKVTVI